MGAGGGELTGRSTPELAIQLPLHDKDPAIGDAGGVKADCVAGGGEPKDDALSDDELPDE